MISYLLYYMPHMKITANSVYPSFGDNKTDKMIAKLDIAYKGQDTEINISEYMSAKTIRDMAHELNALADTIDKYNESEGWG